METLNLMERLNLFPLSDAWTPPKLLVRDNQLNILLSARDSDFPKNFWINGEKGLGKSLTAQIYCKMTKNSFILECKSKSFKENCRMFAMHHGVKPKSTSEPISLILETIEANLQEDGEPVTFFIDDIDRLEPLVIKRDLSTYLSSLYDLMPQISKRFSIHIITTKPFAYMEKNLSDWCISRLRFKSLTFPRYSKQEIEELLLQRLKYIENLQVQPEAVALIADKISRIGGDFRKALELTRNAIEAEGALTLSAVSKAWSDEKTQFWKGQITQLPYHAALLLGCIIEVTIRRHEGVKSEPPYFPVSWNEVKERYRVRCRDFGVSPQSDKMLYYWLEQLWLKKWIDKFTLSKRHEWNYRRQRGMFLRLLEKLDNLVPAYKQIDWSEPW